MPVHSILDKLFHTPAHVDINLEIDIPLAQFLISQMDTYILTVY